MSRMRGLFCVVVFLASFLLFLVEPMAAKQLLPALGGSAAVWITCMVFFQAALLLAYLYAHWLARSARLGLNLLLLAGAAACTLLWSLRGLPAGSGAAHPVTTIFLGLGASIGLPFLALGATSPLLQVWWARALGRAVPYQLYALSNAASLLALALYPSLIEPAFTLHAQSRGWAAGFFLFAILTGWLALRMRSVPALPAPAQENEEGLPRSSLAQRALWVLLPMGAAMQLSAVTAYLTANVAAIPLLWVLPLGVYLVTLILAFQFPRILARGLVMRFLVVLLAGLSYMLTQVDVSLPLRISLAFFLCELFAACLFCHAQAYALRPARRGETTVFYLLFAAGGALGSFLVGIAAPLLFRFNYDLPIAFFITAALALASLWRAGWSQRLLWGAASAALLALVFMVQAGYRRDTIVAVRNFYAALRVKQDYSFPGATMRTLMNGTIQHGTQIFASDALRHTPTTYYAYDSGIGLALRDCCAGRPRSIGVIGLGAGTIAAYGAPGDRIRFYEINPAVPPIAQNAFTYLRESPAQISIAVGDARTTLAHEAPQQFDVLAIDAFSGDAIPLHLLTAQALTLYRRHLAPGGVLAFHISNRYIDLAPPIALLAASAHMQARRVISMADEQHGEFAATWILVSDNDAFFAQPDVSGHSSEPPLQPGLRLWTDDYSSLLPVLRRGSAF